MDPSSDAIPEHTAQPPKCLSVRPSTGVLWRSHWCGSWTDTDRHFGGWAAVPPGFASELGSMLVTEQVDAMRAMGTDPSASW